MRESGEPGSCCGGEMEKVCSCGSGEIYKDCCGR